MNVPPDVGRGPVDEVFRGSEMLASGNSGVADLKQGVGKRFEESSRRTITEGTNSSRVWVEVG
jgi:hypothetical protein